MMDIFVPITLVLVFVINVFGIIVSGGNIANYIDITSIIITLGGGLNALLLASDISLIKKMPKIFGVLAKKSNINMDEMIVTLISFSEKARRDGLLVLEDDIQDVPDQFLKKGLQLVVDGTDPELVRNIMNTEIDQIEGRHDAAKKFFEDAAALFPAWGMIGTLLGLVIMLRGLGGAGGTEMIGRGMAAALITTYYGSILANGFALPIAARLSSKNEDEILSKNVMLEGILSIQAGDNPRIVKDKLISFLPPDKRRKVNESVGDR